MKWYVLHTFSSQENKVKKIIENQKEKWADKDKIGQIKVPTIEMAEMRGGKKKIVKKKFIHGYVFIQIDLNLELQQRIRALPGIMGFVSKGGIPQPLEEEDIQNIFTEMAEQPEEEKVISKILFQEGEVVKILEGPFANFQGTINEVDSDKGKIKVMVEIFGRATPVELDHLQVGKV